MRQPTNNTGQIGQIGQRRVQTTGGNTKVMALAVESRGEVFSVSPGAFAYSSETMGWFNVTDYQMYQKAKF